jgi:hypothetical protein
MRYTRVFVVAALLLWVFCTMRRPDRICAHKPVRDPRFPARQITGPSADDVIEKVSRRLRVNVDDQSEPGLQ